MKKFFNNAFLCFSLLFLSSVVYAQSEKVLEIPLQGAGDDFRGNREDVKRDLGVYSILPTVLYNVADAHIIITSHYTTFESVVYYIVDEFGLVQQQGEMTLRKGDEVEISLSSLSLGIYGIVLEIGGECFQGEFEVE